jgi:hypothetical protein
MRRKRLDAAAGQLAHRLQRRARFGQQRHDEVR